MDFLINYYVIFLMNHHLSMTTGFLIWHAVTFVVMLVILFAAVLFFNLIENVLLTKFFAKDSSEACESPSKMPSTYGFPSVISLGSILIMWLLLSLSTSLYPVKTDIGILLFIAFLFVPVLSKDSMRILNGNYVTKRRTVRKKKNTKHG